MKGRVTSKGQVTIPKPLRDRYGIRTGMSVTFSAAPGGIQLQKVVPRTRKSRALGCLKDELTGHSVGSLLDQLRGPVDLPKARKHTK